MTAPQLFAILNVTPDSFSDGGRYSDARGAIERGIELHEQGADIVDVGGESTRPGAERVTIADEKARVIPVIRGLVKAKVPVSVDTMNAETALAAAEVGASVINDVSGGLADSDMYRVVAETNLMYVAMHWRGHSAAMQSLAEYDDVVADVRAELKARLAEMIVWGVSMDRVIIDPGLGFSKNAEHNWQLLGRLQELVSLGQPLMVGASRKRFLGATLAVKPKAGKRGAVPDDAALEERDLPTAVVSALAAEAGAWAVRVHDVPSTRVALGVWSAWQNGRK